MAINEKGAYLGTTQVWDVSEIYQKQDIGPGLKELLVRMYQNLNNMATMINNKETALYPTEEFVCGKKYFPDPALDSSSSKTPKLRQVYRKIINWNKPLPNATSDSVAHGITFDDNTILTKLYGAATDPTAHVYIPLPYVAPKDDDIALWATATDIWLETFTTDRSNFTIGYIVIEYLKF